MWKVKEMPDNRPICVRCSLESKKIIRLRTEKVGVVIPYGTHGFRPGDLYQCPVCGRGIVLGFGDPVSGPMEHVQQVLNDRYNNILYGVADK